MKTDRESVVGRGTARAKALRRAYHTQGHAYPPACQAPCPLLTRSRPRSSSLSCRCDRDKVLSCWFQSIEPRFRKWALSSMGSLGSASTPLQHPSTLAVTRYFPNLRPHFPSCKLGLPHHILAEQTRADA